MARANTPEEANEPSWRRRAVSRSLSAARTRAEQRVQRFLDAAFELIDEKSTTEFTIQEVVDRSSQSLRSFYQYFDGKDELLFALFEETVRESIEDIRTAVEAQSEPIQRLHAYVIRLHEWCEPVETTRKRGQHNRLPISEFSLQLAFKHPDRVGVVMEPIARILHEVLDGAVAANAIEVADTRRSAVLVQQTVMYSWFVNRLLPHPRMHITAEETWDFCLRGLRG